MVPNSLRLRPRARTAGTPSALKFFFRHGLFADLFDRLFEDNKQNDEGNDVVPALVRRVILPKARAFIGTGWDPRSRQQTYRVQSLVRDLIVYVPSQTDLKVP